MSDRIPPLEGRRVRGIVGFSTRSLAVAFEGEPRAYLWIHLERKEAWYALAPDQPVPPDPRGSRFLALESPLRGATVEEARAPEGGALELRLTPRGGREHALHLTLGADGPRTNLVLRADPPDRILWAFHREEAAATTPPPGAIAPRTPVALPPGYRPPVVRDASEGDSREALRGRIERTFRKEFDAELSRILTAAGRTLARRLEAAEEDRRRAQSMREDRRRAEILLASFGKVPRGASRVGLPDPFAASPQATVEILLDPALPPEENAARLFQRAKKGERGERLAETRLAETRNSLAAFQRLRPEISADTPKKALERVRDFLVAAKLDLGARGDMRETHLGRQAVAAPRAERPGHRPPGARQSVRPRTYVTSDGWEVWVGRNNTENDLITHRLSNPHDFWFHAVGVPGSHVILRRPTRKSTPKPTTLAEAAQIAAYFSKARKQARVPVIYAERKFVSKPRRAKPGQALCTRERELLVRPRKPLRATGRDEIDREVSG